MSYYSPAFEADSRRIRRAGICADCGRRTPPSQLDAHHVAPRRYGGSDALANRVPLCSSCHAKREHETRRLAQQLVYAGTLTRAAKRAPATPRYLLPQPTLAERLSS